MAKYIIVKDDKILAYKGKRDGKFIVLAHEPEFLDNVDEPVVVKYYEAAQTMALQFGGEVKEYTS